MWQQLELFAKSVAINVTDAVYGCFTGSMFVGGLRDDFAGFGDRSMDAPVFFASGSVRGNEHGFSAARIIMDRYF